MSLIIRIWALLRGAASRIVSIWERKNPEALLENEKEKLRKRIREFNEGLVSHAALSERLMSQVTQGEREQTRITATVKALVSAGRHEQAAPHALRLKEVGTRLEDDRRQLEEADRTYQHLVRTRDTSVAEARSNIEQLRRHIGDLKTKRAVADLTSMATSMVRDISAADDSLSRLHGMVQEEREKAAARVRVATGSVEAFELSEIEAERQALAAQALQEFLAENQQPGAEAPGALPDLTQERQPVRASKPETS